MTTRDSNMELLRIIAMLLILLVHASYFSLGAPKAENITQYPLESFVRILVQSIAIICVNLFVLLSGWFGIRTSIKSFSNFIFQCLFFSILIYAIALVTNISTLSIKGVAQVFYATKLNWFIKAYIGLYILAPVLNAFIDSANEKLFRQVLISFFLFQTLYGWATGAAFFFEQGYSTISFCGLYLLARYIRLYSPKWSQFSSKVDLSIFIALTIVTAVVLFFIGKISVDFHPFGDKTFPGIQSRVLSYIAPNVIACSTFFFLIFTKFSFKSKLINWIAASSFAAFLIHANPNLLNFYIEASNKIYNDVSIWLWFPAVISFVLLVFIFSVIVDQLRKVVWTALWNRISKTI